MMQQLPCYCTLLPSRYRNSLFSVLLYTPCYCTLLPSWYSNSIATLHFYPPDTATPLLLYTPPLLIQQLPCFCTLLPSWYSNSLASVHFYPHDRVTPLLLYSVHSSPPSPSCSPAWEVMSRSICAFQVGQRGEIYTSSQFYSIFRPDLSILLVTLGTG